MPRDGSGTRRRIVSTAMRRFVEHGYDKTSLREIADEVGVTKAALYYHFRTKEDIVAAAMVGFEEAAASLRDWSATRPPGPESDAELVDRLVALVEEDAGMALRFAQTNPTVAAAAPAGRPGPAAAMTAVIRAVAGEHPSTDRALRATLGVAAVMLSTVGDSRLPIPGDAQALRDAARRAALDLLAGTPVRGSGA